ncbi:hypothetical protein ACMD2_02091, partial [Ananas comosus]
TRRGSTQRAISRGPRATAGPSSCSLRRTTAGSAATSASRRPAPSWTGPSGRGWLWEHECGVWFLRERGDSGRDQRGERER